MVALRTGKPVPDVLMQVYNPRESRYRLITIQAVPLFRPGEESPYRVYTVFDDVTERQRLLEESLVQAGGCRGSGGATAGTGTAPFCLRRPIAHQVTGAE